jgi:Leucine-rich repeat (LRR) protein
MGRRLCSFSSCVFVSYASIQLPAGIIGLLVFLAILPANLLFLTGAFLWVLMTYGFDGLPVIFMGLRPHGVKFPQGIRKLKALQTLGAINMKGEDAIVAELKYLTKLRKLRVTGLNKKNCVNFCRAIDKHKCLESLLVQSEGNPGLSGCLNGVSSPPENLFSLKLYGNLVKLPPWIKGLHNLVKLVLRSSRISDCSAAMQLLGELPNLATLRLWGASFEDGKEVHISFPRGAFPCLVMLDIRLVPERYSFKSFESSQFNLKSVEFEEGATPMLESVYFHGSYSGTDTGLFSGLVNLLSLKEFTVAIENYTNLLADEVQYQLARNTNRPVLKTYYSS